MSSDNEEEKIDYGRVVDKIDRLLANYAGEGGGQRTVSIGGVSFAYASIADLLRIRAHFKALADAEEAKTSPKRVRHYAIETRLEV